jgi:hypothetical protein
MSKDVLYYLSEGVYGALSAVTHDPARVRALVEPALARAKHDEPRFKSLVRALSIDLRHVRNVRCVFAAVGTVV